VRGQPAWWQGFNRINSVNTESFILLFQGLISNPAVWRDRFVLNSEYPACWLPFSYRLHLGAATLFELPFD
jgi:hypothetical protein